MGRGERETPPPTVAGANFHAAAAPVRRAWHATLPPLNAGGEKRQAGAAGDRDRGRARGKEGVDGQCRRRGRGGVEGGRGGGAGGRGRASGSHCANNPRAGHTGATCRRRRSTEAVRLVRREQAGGLDGVSAPSGTATGGGRARAATPAETVSSRGGGRGQERRVCHAQATR